MFTSRFEVRTVEPFPTVRSGDALGELLAASMGAEPLSDGRPDRRGASVLAVDAAGIVPLRVTTDGGKKQEETLVDMLAATAGVVLGQRGPGAPSPLFAVGATRKATAA